MAWSINPHMVVGAVDVAAAVSQHDAFASALVAAGAELIQLPFVHGAYDSVFAKDNAILAATPRARRALLATPRHSERKKEQGSRRQALEARGFEIVASPALLEGGDVIVARRNLTLLGHGFRSSKGAAKFLSRFLETEVLPLELVDPSLYHLDTALAILRDGTLLYCSAAFTEKAQHELMRRFDRIIDVPRIDALRFALNFVEAGDNIVTGTISPLSATLEALGRRVITTNLDQFQRAGGSAACLVAQVHSLEAASHALAA